MRKFHTGFAAFFFVSSLMHAGAGFAAPAKDTSGRTPEEEKKIAEIRKRVDSKKTDLNGSSWDLVYVGSSDPKMKGKTDKFTFQNGQFMSELLTKRGFNWTNYTITVPPDETSKTAVWETMQTGKEGQIFVRGEWEGERMSGSITEQLDGGNKVAEHIFTTSSRVAIPPTSDGKKESEKKEAVAGSQALVSREAPAKKGVTPFNPGTTEEIPQA